MITEPGVVKYIFFRMALKYKKTPLRFDLVYFFTNLGSDNALSLILNVEQYEYTRGSQNDIGVKVTVFVIQSRITFSLFLSLLHQEKNQNVLFLFDFPDTPS